MKDLDTLVFDAAGLIPCVAQGRAGDVRMVGCMNPEALRRTLDTGFLTFWSRSRQALWTKGETSGNRLKVLALRPDCDRDTLLAIVEPEGPTCHRGTDRIAKKVVEEAGEVILAAKAFEHAPSAERQDEFLGEAADLLFHLDLLLVNAGLSLQDAVEVLKVRHAARTAGKE